jgi:hypothetical protein
MSIRRLVCLFSLLTVLCYIQSAHTLWAAPSRQIVTLQGPTLRG